MRHSSENENKKREPEAHFERTRLHLLQQSLDSLTIQRLEHIGVHLAGAALKLVLALAPLPIGWPGVLDQREMSWQPISICAF